MADDSAVELSTYLSFHDHARDSYVAATAQQVPACVNSIVQTLNFKRVNCIMIACLLQQSLKQEASSAVAERPRLLRVIEYMAKSLKVIQNDTSE